MPRSSAYSRASQRVLDENNQQSPRKCHPRALNSEERNSVLEVLHSNKYVDRAPKVIVAGLLDEGKYLCSASTMYRILRAEKEVSERRRLARSKTYTRPELLAQRPNQVWSWDISKLRGPEKWSYFYLYAVLDIFSRKVVGWAVYIQETGRLAENLLASTCSAEKITAGQLTIHSDRGSPMRSKTVAELFSDLQVSKSFSRPHVSNDNPDIESAFKTAKYMPEYPDRFGCIEDARCYFRKFFNWYNNEHLHSGIEYYTPEDVHNGRHLEKKIQRDMVLQRAWDENPNRFTKGKPVSKSAPIAAWINKPMREEVTMGG
jgi:putative transposase